MTDREIVIVLAEKVMGWKIFHVDVPFPGYPLIVEKGDHWRFYGEDGAGSRWNPLESISDAWMIVGRMHKLKCHFVLGAAPQNQTTAWFIDWTWAIARVQNEVPPQDDDACLGSWTSDNAVRAICKAAIRAIDRLTSDSAGKEGK